MALTSEEEADIKARILKLEEELTAAKKREEGVSRKADLDLILADLKEARKELTALKAGKPSKPSKGPEAHEDDPGDILDIIESNVEGAD